MGTILLILSEHFDDMLFLSCQVILEEAGHDVIVASKESGTFKGSDSSVMAVSLEEALSQDLLYTALIVIGGSEIEDWTKLINTLRDFLSNNRLIGLNSSVSGLLNHLNIQIEPTQSIIQSNGIVYLSNLDHSEEYAELLAKEI